MKVAVYTIALNEEQFVKRWAESAQDADVLLIADTGSTDNTKAVAESLGVQVVDINIKPWRFDDARNASLAALPADMDYCIALDMDEILLPGWRDALELAHQNGWTRPRYEYTWSWNADGTPGLIYGGDKIHSRAGYRWKHPVHEVITRYGAEPETQGWVDLKIHHHPDNTKSRSQYGPMLAMAVAEDPHDDRNAFYYARELYFMGNHPAAIAEFKRHLELPKASWAPERAASMRYLAKMDTPNTESWLLKALDTSWRREVLVDLAKFYYDCENWKLCRKYALEALKITDKPLDYLCEAEAWGWMPYDLAAISHYWLGDKKSAKKYGELALELNPNDERLKQNQEFYTS